MDPAILAAIIAGCCTLVAGLCTIAAAFIQKSSNGRAGAPTRPKPAGEATPAEEPKSLEQPSDQLGRRVLGVGLIFGCAVLFGISHVLSRKLMIKQIDPWFAVGFRNVVAGGFIALVALVAGHFSERRGNRIEFDRFTWLAIAGRAVSGVFYFYALIPLTAAAGIMLYKLNPIYTMVLSLALAPLATRRKIAIFPLVLGTVVSVIGAMLGAVKFDIAANVVSFPTAGILLMIGAGIAWSLFLVAWEKHRSSDVDDSDFSRRQFYVSQIYLLSALPLAVVVVWKLVAGGIVLNDSGAWLEVGLIGVISGTIGVLYFESVKRIGALLASIIVGFEVYFTIFFEKVILGQPASFLAIVGGALVIVGAVFVARENRTLIKDL